MTRLGTKSHGRLSILTSVALALCVRSLPVAASEAPKVHAHVDGCLHRLIHPCDGSEAIASSSRLSPDDGPSLIEGDEDESYGLFSACVFAEDDEESFFALPHPLAPSLASSAWPTKAPSDLLPGDSPLGSVAVRLRC